MAHLRKKKQKRVKRHSRRSFRVEWVRFPARWIKALRQTKSASTYELALTILIEAFRCEQGGGEIILSAEKTEMAKNTRVRAIRELVRLRLIKVGKEGNHATRVTHIYN
jgi:hypothetical protein